MGCAPHGGSSDMHPVMHPNDGIFSTQRLSIKTPVDGCALHGGGFNIYPSWWWDFLHSEADMRFSTAGICPYLEDHLCTLLDRTYPRMEMLTQTSMSIHPHTPMMGFPSLRSRFMILHWWDVPHSKDRTCTLLYEMCPYMKVLTQTCLRAFLGHPMGAETLCCQISPKTWSAQL